MLSCPPVLLTNVVIIVWEIILRDKPPCIRAYRRDKNETTETNCTDKRMTWPNRSHQNSVLQIDPVAITHEGYYRCIVAALTGNFHHGYQLRVLVAPEVTLFQSENRSAVCKAVAGRPAARISWTPAGDCVPPNEYWSNGTVTVQSRCHWADGNVSIVSCSVFHETGNWSWSVELNQDLRLAPEKLANGKMVREACLHVLWLGSGTLQLPSSIIFIAVSLGKTYFSLTEEEIVDSSRSEKPGRLKILCEANSPSLTQQEEDEPDNKQPGDHLGHGKEDCTENIFLAMLAVIICTVILPRANVEVFQTYTPDPA
ncbi:Cell surface glycoprotein CD200 receptor 1 [Myotis davidii]|uniref:Cell surface glycoprotein CD200 receptor 1 n=1 Tax=Myotis davidii TaxID=225400 RepID=L5MID6_MYODS|nr:Cell surface glycoprotein CD200 receptor 1 [Myotis davidii]